MHADEAVHAVKLGILMETGAYEYNPREYHGPFIYYAALPFVWATGADTLADIPDETPLRVPIVVFGALLVFAVAMSGGAIGRPAAAFAALLVAVSPAFSFYGRYYIQEVPFVLCCFIALAAAWKLLETHRVVWAVAMGLALGAAIALKETWVLVMGTAALSAGLLHLTSTRHPWPLPFPWRRFIGVFALAVAVSIFTGLFLLSNFFRNPAAIPDAFAAIAGYAARGVTGDSSTFGAGIHDHPWYYYLRLLAWPEVAGPWIWTEAGTLLLGGIGIVAVIRRWETAPGQWHFIVIFTIILTAFYSAIPYKTPWNVLPMLLGWCLLAGRGGAGIIGLFNPTYLSYGSNESSGSHKADGTYGTTHKTYSSHPVPALITLLLLAWPGWLAFQSWRATLVRPADVRNPYAYSATSSNTRRLVKRANQIAAVAPAGHEMIIQIVSPANDYWPLPWYLRQFPNMGFYTDATAVRPETAMIIRTNNTADSAPETITLDENSMAAIGPRMTEFYGLRPEILLTVDIRQDLWDAFIKTRMNKLDR